MKKLMSSLALAAGLALVPAMQAAAFTVSIFDSGSAIGSLAEAQTLANGTATNVVHASVIEFDDLQDGSRGRFGVNNAFPVSPSETFAVKVTGQVFLATAGTYSFGINSDDGAKFSIDGILAGGFDGVADNREAIYTSTFAAGYHTVEILYFENSGGASLEFFGKAAGDADYSLVQAVPEPGSLALVGLSLLGLAAARRRRG
jgi:hypothetical protein